MSRKTVDIPSDWTPPKRERKPLIAWLPNPFRRRRPGEPDEAEMAQGFRNTGNGTYAPPSRYSDWRHFP